MPFMKIRHPWLIRFLAFVAAWLVRGWIGTLRHRLLVVDGREHPADARHERYLYAFWHEALLLPALFRARIHFLISQHADGEFIAHVCRHLGAGVVRGSTTRGGGPALMEMMRWSRRTHLGITPDGPRGPRRRVQPGVVFLASATGLPIAIFGVGCNAGWRAPSWDRMAIPRPFSLVTLVVAPAFSVPPNLDRAGIEHYRQRVEEQFVRATETAERWAATGQRPNLGDWGKPGKAARLSA
jgi:lysophospholipid acyltransferase (LPLAT)-like uncharacterized protein